MAVATETRDRILEAACDLIAAQGIDEMRIARVAQRAGASTALVHHYFSTREELLEEALVHSFDHIADERFGPGAPPPASATEGLARAIAQCLPEPGVLERDFVLWVELWLRASRDPALRPGAARLYARYRRWIADAIRPGVESGEFASVDVEATADHAMALFDGIGVRALLRDPQMSLERARTTICGILGRELGIDPKDLAEG